MTFVGYVDGDPGSGLITPPWAGYTDNSTLVYETVLANITDGVVFGKGVAFDLALMNSIPANVKVVCSYGDEQYTYINSADTSGSPYTVEVGAGLNAGYYTAKDSENRIVFSSTVQATIESQVYTAAGSNGSVILRDLEHDDSVTIPIDIAVTQYYGGETTYLGSLTIVPSEQNSLLVAKYHFEDTGTLVTDSSGFENNGVMYLKNLTGTAIYATSPATNQTNFPSVIKLQNGTFIMAFYNATAHTSVVGRILVTSSADGATWTAPQVLLDTDLDDREVNLIQAANGTVFGVIRSYNATTGVNIKVYVVTLQVDGSTWISTEITDLNGNAPTSLIQLDDTRFMMGYYTATEAKVCFSTDGISWVNTTTIPINGYGTNNEPYLADLGSGEILVVLRSDYYGNKMFTSKSLDYGVTWSTPKLMPLVTAGAAPRITLLDDGQTLLLMASKIGVFSYDDGETWDYEHAFVINTLCYGYSNLLSMGGGSYRIVFTTNTYLCYSATFTESSVKTTNIHNTGLVGNGFQPIDTVGTIPAQVLVPSTKSLASLTSFAVECQVKFNAMTASSNQYLIFVENDWYISTKNADPRLLVFTLATTSGYERLNSTTTLATDVWYDIVVSYDNTSKVAQIFINGRLDAECTIVGTFSLADLIKADGCISIFNPNAANVVCDAVIDEVKIFAI